MKNFLTCFDDWIAFGSFNFVDTAKSFGYQTGATYMKNFLTYFDDWIAFGSFNFVDAAKSFGY